MRFRLLQGALLSLMLSSAAGCGGDSENEPPQILPALNPIAYGNFAPEPSDTDTCGGERPCIYDLQLVNTGNQPLEITGVEVRGDANCAIPDPPEFESGGQTATVSGHDSIFLHLEYTPGGTTPSPLGKDQISMEITSNASDYPSLLISICGCVVEGDPTTAELCACNLNEVGDQTCGQ